MADQEVTTKFKVDISDLKKNITDANQQMKLANAQFKASASAMDDWGSSADGVSAKIKQMTKIVDLQESKLTAYKSQLARVQEAYEENGKRAEDLRQKMVQLIENGVDPASSEYKQYQRALQDVTKEQDANKKAADDLEITILNQEAALNSTKKELGNYETALNELERAQEEASKGTEKQKTAYESLQDTVDEQQKSLDSLKQTYADTVVQYGKNSQEAKDLEGSIKELSGELATNKQKLKDADAAADDLDSSMADVGDATDKATGGFTVMKGVLANLAAEAIKKAIDGLKNLGQAAYDAYQEYDEGADTVIKATGATGEAAEGLAASYKKVTKSVVGDFNDIGSALGEINTRFGFTDKKLEDASVQFMKFADITGTDATQAVKLVSRAMGDAGIESDKYSEVLDDLALAAQASGISVEDLTGNLAKYGAPMRALGLDTKESIAIFAGWEKAGVNTEIAFSGMKQAIGKWGKEGKDARKEFKKTLDEIAACPDIASATTKAIEVFGQKAGPDLADAIQGGRFEYSNFLDLLEGSKGTVTKTYEATQDGFDKVKLAIQGGRAELGDYIAQLADKYSPQIEEFANKSVDAIKKVIQWVTENINTLATFAGALAAAFAVSKIATFINTMAQTVGVIKGVTTAIQGAEAATKLLNLAQAATPWGLAALAIAGVGTALVALKKEQDKAIEAEYGLTEAQKASVSAAKEAKKAYEQMDSARKESMQNISAEYGYLDELKTEYNSLIDSNGKVKEGYEDRANFILEQLANALGVEREEIEKNIDANGRMGKSIDTLIQKKQAEAILAANQDAYTTAIQKRDEAMKQYQSSLKTLEEAEKTYQDSVNESGNVLETYQEMLRTAPSTADDYYWANQKIILGQQEAKKAYDDAKKGVEDSEKAYLGYINTISNYEGLSAAIISGDADAIKSAMTAIQNSLITAENGTKESLEKQLKNAEKNYKDMKKAAADGMAGVSQETVDQAAEMVEMSKKELAKFNGTFIETFDQLKTLCKANGIEIPQSVAQGIQSGKYALPQSVEEMQALVSFDSLITKCKDAGINVPEYVTNGINDGSMKPAEAVKIMNDFVTYNDLLADAKQAGISVPQEITDGVNSGQMTPAQAVAKLNDLMEQEANSSAEPMNTAGQKAGVGYISGVNKSQKDAKTAGTNLKSNAQKGATGSLNKQGKDAGSSYNKGVTSNTKGAKTAGSDLKKNATSGATGNITKEGKDAGSTYAKGVSSNASGAKTAGSTLKKNATTGATGNMTKEGKEAGSTYTKGVSSQASSAKSAGNTLKKNVTSGATGSLNKEGKDAGSGYVEGVNSKTGSAKNAGKKLKSEAKSGASGGYSGMKSVGKDAAEGFKDGILSKASSIANAAASLVRKAINAAKSAQKSASPSKIWRDEIGAMSGEGYIVGLANKIRPAMKEAQTLVKDSINAASKEVSKNPIDVSDFGASLKSSIASAAGSLTTSTGRFGAGSQQGSVTGDTVITYNQTINAPKAPSRIELYRQTRNLLEYTKGGV